MNEEKLILRPFQDALASLNDALAQDKNEYTRDASIQRFEYTYELAWKSLKRYLAMETGSKEFNIKNLYREAAKQGILDAPENWFAYHTARNLTVHTYNEKTAEETYLVAKQFAVDATKLLSTLQALINNAT